MLRLRNRTVETLKTLKPNNCGQQRRGRKRPRGVSHQELRNLRCGNNSSGCPRHIVVCQHCIKGWTAEEAVELYLKRKLRVKGLTEFPDNRTTRRLHAMIAGYQKMKSQELKANPKRRLHKGIIHAAHQLHRSEHVKGCFKANDKFRKKRRKSDKECRFHLPTMERTETVVNVLDKDIDWFNWNGTRSKQKLFEVMPKRLRYDVFQNPCCRAVSESKLACNSNVSMQTPGPLSCYQVKYTTKNTQIDDTEEYSEVSKTVKKMLGPESQRKYEEDSREAMRKTAEKP